MRRVLYTLLMMNFKIALPLLFLLTISPIAKSACVSIKSSDVILKWTAFKTPLRQAVTGEFKNLILKKNGKSQVSFLAKDIPALLQGLEIEIQTSSVSTGIAQRDTHIREYFFKDMTIKSRLTKVENKELSVDVYMNQKLVHSKLKWSQTAREIHAEGYLDILDFAMDENLHALTKQCFALHEGKTWNDVQLEIIAPIAECKS